MLISRRLKPPLRVRILAVLSAERREWVKPVSDEMFHLVIVEEMIAIFISFSLQPRNICAGPF